MRRSQQIFDLRWFAYFTRVDEVGKEQPLSRSLSLQTVYDLSAIDNGIYPSRR
jgi:hypothetical protein